MAFFRTVSLADQMPAVAGDGVVLRSPQMSDWAEWAALREASRDFLTPWEPTWPADELLGQGGRGSSTQECSGRSASSRRRAAAGARAKSQARYDPDFPAFRGWPIAHRPVGRQENQTAPARYPPFRTQSTDLS